MIINKMSSYNIATQIPFSELVIGQRYKFLWGPYDIFLSGVCVVNENKNGIADFADSRHENGITANGDGYTASAGDFYSIDTRVIYARGEN